MSNLRGLIILGVTTWAFIVCFAVWLMFGVIGIPIRRELGLNALEFGLLTSTPVLTGALFRLPLGIWTDSFGGRIVMLLLLVGCAVPLWISSYASQLWQFLLLGLALGLVGASFAVGTPYVARFFPKESRGFAMGVFGAGTTGAAINMFVAPVSDGRYGWQSVPRFYAVALLVTRAVLVPSRPRIRGQVRQCASDAAAIGGIARSSRLEILPILFDRVWRLHSFVGLDAAIFQERIWLLDRAGVAACGVLLAARRRISGCRRLAVGPLWRSQRDLVGAVGGLDRLVPAVLSENRAIVHTIRGPASFGSRLATLALHRVA